MAKIVLLGAGMVGRAMAVDLSENHQLTAVDIDPTTLEALSSVCKLQTLCADLADTGLIAGLVKGADLVLSAVPGFMGYRVLEAIIRAGKPVVDISFMPEDFMRLNDLAVAKGVTVITDCGVAPGMPNLIAGFYNECMEISRFEYMVGGLPRARSYPFYYKAPFSPIDVLEEYIRPARFREKGRLISKAALSDAERVHFDRIGTLEAFNTDGLRSLLSNLPHVPDMREKTLRYPGHIQLIEALKACGFFDTTPMQIQEQVVRPMDLTAELLIREWKLEEGEPEFTVMRILLEGKMDGKHKMIAYELYDEYDSGQGLSSMARTTGFTATAHAELVLQGLFNGRGVYPPELVGMDADCFHFVMDYLARRNVIYTRKES